MTPRLLASLYIAAKEQDFKSFSLSRYVDIFNVDPYDTENEFEQLINAGLLKQSLLKEKYSLTDTGLEKATEAFLSFWCIPEGE